MKECFKCNVVKPLDQFYKNGAMADGRVNKCMNCNKLDVKINYDKKALNPDFINSERDRHREKYHRLGYIDKHRPTKEMKKLAITKHREKYPEKYKAKIVSQRVGVSVIGNHLHHWNYNVAFAKDVIELNPKHHATVHRFIRYDKETFMYKDLNNNLLDTKTKHLEYINSILI
jgi:hypothetical protein